MDEYDIWAEEQRQRFFLRQQEEQQRKSNQKEAEVISEITGGIIGIAISIVILAFTILGLFLKYFFKLIKFLRNKFFIHWNWYVKTENAIYQSLVWIEKTTRIFLKKMINIFFVSLYKHWELWLVIGIVLLYYCYKK